MHSILYYSRLIGHAILEQITNLRKGLVEYFKSNEIIALKENVGLGFRV
jgi:hypothetical protein